MQKSRERDWCELCPLSRPNAHDEIYMIQVTCGESTVS